MYCQDCEREISDSVFPHHIKMCVGKPEQAPEKPEESTAPPEGETSEEQATETVEETVAPEQAPEKLGSKKRR